MLWLIYLTASILISAILARISKKYYFEIFILLLIVFFTPAQIEVSESNYAPSLFSFIFNLIFKQDFSTRVLRPLLISLPLGLIVLYLYSKIKRKFS